MRNDPYKHGDFWTEKGDTPSVVGDYRGRIPLLERLNPQKGEKICEPGSGAGFVARKIARAGALVWGCDIEPAMINAATRAEEEDPLGIAYTYADISQHLPYANGFFDAIACYGTLMHLSPEQMPTFAREAYRVLRSEGRLLFSITHAELYPISVEFKAEDASWIRHEVLGEIVPCGSQYFKEYYRNSKGQISEAEVWCHPVHFLRRTFAEAGFKIQRDYTDVITREDLDAVGLCGPTGYPAFYQLEGCT